MSDAEPRPSGKQIIWPNVITVISVAILIAAEVFGAGFAAGWALSSLFELGDTGALVLQVIFFLLGIAVIVSFVRAAQRIEPFVRGG